VLREVVAPLTALDEAQRRAVASIGAS
jgi:hypothetical protein